MTEEKRTIVPTASAILEDGTMVRYGAEYDRPITNRWIGSILKKRLNVQTYKSHGVYVVPVTERSKVALLCKRYGIEF